MENNFKAIFMPLVSGPSASQDYATEAWKNIADAIVIMDKVIVNIAKDYSYLDLSKKNITETFIIEFKSLEDAKKFCKYLIGNTLYPPIIRYEEIISVEDRTWTL